MSLSEIKASTDSRMGKSLESLKTGLAKIRTGRATAGLLDHIQVEYYGSMVPVSQVGNITVVDARTLNVQVWEKHMAGPIEKAIRDNELGLNPISMGESIRVPMPALTEERRRDLAKVVRGEGEDAKVAFSTISAPTSAPRKAAAVSVVKNGLPVPAAKITTLFSSR